MALEDRKTGYINPTRGLIHLGTFHKGDVKQERTGDGKAYQIAGSERPHWRVTLKDETLQPTILELYGDKPTRINHVYLFGETAQQAFDPFYTTWTGNNLLRVRCNGHEQIEHRLDSGLLSREPIACAGRAEGKCPLGCKPTGQLRVYLPEFSARSGVDGFFTFGTSSSIDTDFISGALAIWEDRLGTLKGVPWTLWREERRVEQIINGKPSQVPHWFIKIAPEPAFLQDARVQALIVNRRMAALSIPSGVLALPETVNPDTGEIDATMPHWFEVQDSHDKFMDWITSLELTVEQLPDLINKTVWDFDNPRDCCRTIYAASKARQAAAQNSAIAENSKDKDVDETDHIDGNADPVDETYTNDVPDNNDSYLHLEINLEGDRLCDQFGLSVERVQRELGVKDWLHFKTPIHVRMAVRELALAKRWPVVATQAVYDKKGAKIRFKTALGDISAWSRTEIIKWAHDGGCSANWNSVAKWETAEDKALPQSVFVVWDYATPLDQSKGLKATGIRPVEKVAEA